MTARAPLEGITVLDLSTVLMGPLATQILADHGARVIKVEPPSGDIVRWLGPSRSKGMGPLFLHLNRGKEGVALDLKDARAREAVMRLAADADVVVHNLRPKVMRRLGFGFDAVKAVNPRVVYCSLYGFGQDGPYADRPAYDDLIQGASGLPSLMQAAGTGEPRYVALNIADRLVGISAAYAITIGILARDRTGQAQEIDVPMFETLASQVLSEHMYGRSFEPPLGPAGYPRLLTSERRPFATADGHICVVCYTDAHWKRFLTEIGRDDLLSDPRFVNVGARLNAISEVYGFLADRLRAQPTAHWLEVFDRLDIPATPLNTVDSLIDDPQASAVGLIREVDHPTEGRIRTHRNPVLWGGQPTPLGLTPLLGQHTVEVLTAAGVSAQDIAAMQADGVAVDGRPATAKTDPTAA
ncbi:CaiB/BaiF CoA transferase family protein [Futiania mangrovi]|uniref:CoA transferase n=1 Tax=Futiania mangrovi TaxID=2959716 RepID=A0A9J6PDP4_9PROT|nr:CoA transferase [Futiania mangrovii]MCP1336769.1 CoA transferase [Futiania mangrovii]